jgi:hypothetical protein
MGKTKSLERQVEVGFLLRFGVEIIDYNNAIGSVIGPFVKG